MKISAMFGAALLTMSSLAFADVANGLTEDLYVIEGQDLISVGQLIANEEDVQALYGFDNFCYQGSAMTVIKALSEYKKTDLFFSGGGGGWEYVEGTVIRGIVRYDLKLTFKDEVAEGEFKTVNVKPCSYLKK